MRIVPGLLWWGGPPPPLRCGVRMVPLRLPLLWYCRPFLEMKVLVSIRSPVLPSLVGGGARFFMGVSW